MFAFRFFVCLVLLPALCSTVLGQDYRLNVRKYGLEEGLPHRQVNYVFQDHNGFIWGATNDGVFRFDGRRFKLFSQSEHGLTGSITEWLAEDPEGNIWIGRNGENGWIDVLNPLTETITHSDEFFRQHPIPAPLSKMSLRAPFRLPDGTLVLYGVGEKRGWLTWHPQRGWHEVVVPDCNGLFLWHVSDQQEFWATITNAQAPKGFLAKLDASGRILLRFDAASGGNIFPVDYGVSHQSSFPMLYYQPGGPHLWEIHPDGSHTERPLPSPEGPVFQYAIEENGAIQVQFPGLYDREGHLLLDLRSVIPELDPTQFRKYFRDRDGNLWFSTTFGLVVVELHRDHFRRLLYDPQAPGGRGLACRGLFEKNGHLLVNTEVHKHARRLVDLQTGQETLLEGLYTIGLSPASDGNLWSDLGSINWQKAAFGKVSTEGVPLGQPFVWQRDWATVWCFFEENPQRLLMLHVNGISVVNPQTGEHGPWPTDPEYPELANSTVSYAARDRSGRIWMCSEQGLYELKPGGGVLGRYWSGGQGDHYLPCSQILHFYQDAAGIFWLGTSGGGLIRWDGHTATQIQRKNGLLNNVVYAVYEDHHQHLWMPTDYGIVQFDKNTLQVRRTWLVSDGVTHNEFNRQSHFQGADGTLYFGGLNGITAFNPDEFYGPSDERQGGKTLVISNLSVLAGDSKRLENRLPDLLQHTELVVQPDDRYLQLEFALLDFVSQEKVSYTWKLEGESADWEVLNEPVLRLSGLASGTHHLRIRAQALDGTMAVNELNIRLRVLPPVYLRWWFLLTALFVVAAGVRAWLWWRTRAHRQEQERLEAEVQRQTATIRSQTEELKRLDSAKSRFFANVSHELRTPLTLILGPISSLLKSTRIDPQDRAYASIAHQHSNQLLQLVNEILDLSKLEAGKMVLNERPVVLSQLLRQVASAFESHAEMLQIQFVYEYRAPFRLRLLADADKLQKVVSNLLSNALKFTPPHADGCVTLRVEQADNAICIGVHDTGRGIHPDDLPHVFDRFFQTAQPNAAVEGGTGIGLALCREFAGLMQGCIWVESEPGHGSHFYFELPLKEVLGIGEEEVPDTVQVVPTAPLTNGVAAAATTAARVLLVEDNDSLRSYIRSLLTDRYEVVEAENGQMALQMLDQVQPQLIISDIMMPVMDGFQLLERLKSDDRWRHLPVVMLTARADIRDKLRALRVGVDDYLLKPFDEEELLARVANLLTNFQQRSTLVAAVLDGDDDLAEERSDSGFSAEDLEWLTRLEHLVRDSVGDSRLSADWLAGKMFVGRNLFFKRVKHLTGLTPNEYVQTIRMAFARELLETRACQTVKEAAYTVGLRDVKYFSEQFSKHFGRLPSSYL